jgi:1-acyl-sn-glycerol-3-phosphate acyltransferase
MKNFYSSVRSLCIWSTIVLLLLLGLPLMAVRRLFDRDPAHYGTGYLFRRIGKAMTVVNPAWKIHISGGPVLNPRNPYIVVSNHQSLADIPIISNLPWEMKWVAKKELFSLPVVGWMLKLAGDIGVDRRNARSGAQALIKAQRILGLHCSVMIFPEGTRTADGRVRAFTDGAFHLAVKTKTPILPIALEGSMLCIPKHGWKFGEPSDIELVILPPVDTSSLTLQDVPALREKIRTQIMETIAARRNVPVDRVDGTKNIPPG